jgi:hypothetical protein
VIVVGAEYKLKPEFDNMHGVEVFHGKWCWPYILTVRKTSKTHFQVQVRANLVADYEDYKGRVDEGFIEAYFDLMMPKMEKQVMVIEENTLSRVID